MAYDEEHCDGFDKYGPVNRSVAFGDMAGEWNTTIGLGLNTLMLTNSLVGPGQSMLVRFNPPFSGTAAGQLYHPFRNNLARAVGTAYILADASHNVGVTYVDGGTPQMSIGIQATTGRPFIARGDLTGAVLATGAATVPSGQICCIQWDFTVNNTTGAYRMWLNGSITIPLATNQNTRVSGNNYFNAYGPATTANAGFPNDQVIIDHLWTGCYLAGGGSDTPPLTNALIETTFPTGDSTPINFTPGPGVLGSLYQTTSNTNAPGANELALRQWTPVVNCTLDSVTIWIAGTNSAAKFKPAVYADSAGAPGSLLSSGPEVVGAASAPLTLNLTSPQSLVAGTPYWLGYITDTSVPLGQNDTGTLGFKAANTYASGAPATAPAMTALQPSWGMYGNVTTEAHNWAQVSDPYGNNFPLYDNSYNSDSTVNDEDLFTFGALTGTPANIYTVVNKAFMKLDSAGSHTLDLPLKSGSTTGNGDTTGITPSPSSYGWGSSFFDQDPATSAAWASAAAVNAATSGYKIVT